MASVNVNTAPLLNPVNDHVVEEVAVRPTASQSQVVVGADASLLHTQARQLLSVVVRDGIQAGQQLSFTTPDGQAMVVTVQQEIPPNGSVSVQYTPMGSMVSGANPPTEPTAPTEPTPPTNEVVEDAGADETDARKAKCTWALYVLGLCSCILFPPLMVLFWVVALSFYYCQSRAIRALRPRQRKAARVTACTFCSVMLLGGVASLAMWFGHHHHHRHGMPRVDFLGGVAFWAARPLFNHHRHHPHHDHHRHHGPSDYDDADYDYGYDHGNMVEVEEEATMSDYGQATRVHYLERPRGNEDPDYADGDAYDYAPADDYGDDYDDHGRDSEDGHRENGNVERDDVGAAAKACKGKGCKGRKGGKEGTRTEIKARVAPAREFSKLRANIADQARAQNKANDAIKQMLVLDVNNSGMLSRAWGKFKNASKDANFEMPWRGGGVKNELEQAAVMNKLEMLRMRDTVKNAFKQFGTDAPRDDLENVAKKIETLSARAGLKR